MTRLGRIREFLLPIGIIACLMVILMPLPAVLMDFLLVANIAISVIVLMTAVYVKSPLEFSIFPTVLLATTVSRLVLNIATTRLILTQAATEGMNAAGGVIQSFGQFVTGNQIMVGVVIFSIIAVVQFVVITKGATRISEVGARFMLDGMPGRQMAIDADLAAGAIDEAEARRRRSEIVEQADFYGAMDGASKFVRGDAIASVFITAINIVGGLVIGIISYHMSPIDAAEVFTKLTIGDGLVSQVPALLVSLAAGTLVTRSTKSTNLPVAFLNQIFAKSEVLAIAGGFLILLIMTSLPKVPLLMLGSSCAGVAFVLSRNEKATPDQARAAVPNTNEPKPKPEHTERAEPRIEEFLTVDPIEVELGINLLGLADPKRGGGLLGKITKLRQSVAHDMGIVLPKVRIRDNLKLEENTYRISINGSVVTSAHVVPTKYYAVPQRTDHDIVGREVKHPLFNNSIYEVTIDERADAESAGAAILDASTLLLRHLHKTVTQFADELLTRDATRHLLDELKKTSPAIVDELVPGQLTIGKVQHVLQQLLIEHIPIRQLSTILETLGDHAHGEPEAGQLVEQVRQRLGRTISQRFRDDDGRLHVVTLDPGLEGRIRHACTFDKHAGIVCRFTAEQRRAFYRSVRSELKGLVAEQHRLILLVNANIRAEARTILESEFPDVIVLSYSEISPDTRVVSMGIVEDINV
ncbi:MAG: FHIPEP family type III secretion protein [Planctomycetales bacterium]|nr:FHIPEP family type III secretion protein [Planctomycetales bacterium]